MKILHIIRNPNDATPLEIAEAQGREHKVSVLLLHDGVYANPDAKIQVYVCAADALARGVTGHECVELTMQIIVAKKMLNLRHEIK